MRTIMKMGLVVALLITASTTSFAQKFGYINTAEVFTLMPEKDSADIKVQALQQELMEQLEAMEVELNKKYEGISPEAMENLRRENARLRQELEKEKARAAELIARGATWCETPADCAQDCDVVISIVGYPQDVREVWMGRHGAFNTMKPGSIGVDMTTSAPELAQELAKSAADKGFSVVDCPVTGGDIGARNAALTILCGGDKAAIDALEPVFKVVGKKWVYFGEAGMGQMAKACNQVAIASSMFSACEAIVFAKHMGLDPALAIETLCGGAAGSFSLQSYGPRILKRDFAPGFKIAHFLKDMEIALKVCNDRGISLPGLDLAHKAYKMLKEMGKGELGTQALYLFYSSLMLPDLATTERNDTAQSAEAQPDAEAQTQAQAQDNVMILKP